MKYDFGVKLQPLYAGDSDPIIKVEGRKAIVNEDTGKVMGIVSDDYALVKHKEVIDTFNKVEPITLKSVAVCNEGAIMLAKYDFKDAVKISKAEVKKGDIVKFQVRVFNSYNRAVAVGFEIVALRLVCTNGLTIPKGVAEISYKHFHTFKVEELGEFLHRNLAEARGTVQVWKQWADLRPPEAKIKGFFGGLPMSKKQREALVLKCAGEPTLWEVFNHLTYYLSHDFKAKKQDNFALIQRNNEVKWLGAFYKYNWN
jgi:hypothetical protein